MSKHRSSTGPASGVTPELIRRYLSGELDGKAMHALEKQALEDPLLADALEGYARRDPDQRRHLEELRQRLDARTARRAALPPRSRRIWMAAAAAAALLLAGVWGIYRLQYDGSPPGSLSDLVMQESRRADSGVGSRADSGSVAASAGQPAVASERDSGSVAAKATGQNAPSSGAGTSLVASERGSVAAGAEKQVTTAKRPAEPEVASASPSGKVNPVADGLQEKERVPDTPAAPVLAAASGSGHDTAADDAGSRDIAAAAPAARDNARKVSIFSVRRKAAGYARQQAEGARIGEGEVQVNDTVTGLRPQPEGGYFALRQYLSDSLRYPRQALAHGTEGNAKIAFMVMPDGSLQDIQVLEDPGWGCGEEAVRLLKAGPVWKPAADGRPARVSLEVPFTLP
ncbi:energy transducer TonB [Compostibacter hankyongensis]|uniref:Carboxypeptidase-like regulatory domain-containing protein n=1 Tax=Compostibacter hankyongensis TaxID=1007089 RepID=A0ABP8FSF8_9BACT